MNDEPLFQARRFQVVRRRRQTADGRDATREVVLHPGAVAILPLVDADHVCLIRNYRVAVEAELIELPTGTLEPGEPPERTALRELAEETGYHAGRIRPLGQWWMSPGILRERMHLFLAQDLRPGSPARETGEEIENLVVPWAEAVRMVCEGAIEDAKTVAGILLYDRLRGSRS